MAALSSLCVEFNALILGCRHQHRVIVARTDRNISVKHAYRVALSFHK